MSVIFNRTTYNENEPTGDTTQGTYPRLGPNSNRTATFTDTINSSDSDYFVIDVLGGSHDWAGSVSTSTSFDVTVQFASNSDNLAIEWRLEDWTRLNSFGPSGQHAFFLRSVDGTHTTLSATGAEGWTTEDGRPVPSDAVLEFQVISYGYQGSYTITITTSGGGGGGGGGGGSNVDLTASMNGLNRSAIQQGGDITVNYNISNLGSGSTANSPYGVYISTNSTISTSDILIFPDNLGNLGPNETVGVSASFSMP